MKKLLWLITLLLVFPLASRADVDYDIEHYYIQAEILANGDMNVQEAIFVDGEFNGYERDILYAGEYGDTLTNASAIENLKIYGQIVNQADFQIFKANVPEFQNVYTAMNGDKGKYILTNITDGYRMRMYYPANDAMVVFVIKYTLKDVVISHNDVAEMRWNFIGWDFADDLYDLQIKVKLPGIDESDNFRFWANAQTNLMGEVEKTTIDGATGIYAHSEKIDAYDPVTIRTTFAKSLIDEGKVTKHSNRDALSDILAEEQINADNANALRKEIKIKYIIGMGTTIAFLVGLVITWIYTYLVHDKERKPKFQLKYNREFIDDYNVEVIDYLFHKNITPNALSAAILNLIYKKNISFTEIPDSKKKDYQFTLVTKDNLNETENILVDFLFTKVGHDNVFTTQDLKKYASGTKTCNTFMSSYTKWQNAVKKDGEQQGFFESKTMIVPGILFLIFGWLIFVLNRSLEVESILSYTTGFLGVAYFLYTLTFTKKTEKGIEHYAQWQAFKNFLNDFGTFELKELPEITLWDRYLVYATIFGLADKVEKAMNVRIKEIDIDNYDYTPIFIYNHVNIGNTINSSISSAVNSAQATVSRQNASSSFSSGSGFGGGFSGGGGFGGGGGGGHGF